MRHSRHSDALFLGVSYGVGLFVAGFLIAIVRILWLVDRVGEPIATFIEVPIMLAFAWIWCGRLMARSWLERSALPRLWMGLTGFAVLSALELLGALAMEGSLTTYLAGFGNTERMVGLAAQLFAAAIPLLRR